MGGPQSAYTTTEPAVRSYNLCARPCPRPEHGQAAKAAGERTVAQAKSNAFSVRSSDEQRERTELRAENRLRHLYRRVAREGLGRAHEQNRWVARRNPPA